MATSRFKAFTLVVGATLLPLQASSLRLDLQEANWTIGPSLTTKAWTYNGQVPGTPIRVAPGERLVIEGTNRLPVATNIHWHGLEVPNDQDGPMKTIRPGESYRYEFTVPEAGTYWYHSHFRPVLEQMDMGLYGAFIVTAPEDARYSGDHVLVLDDWHLDAQGRRLKGTSRGDMERFGNVETVNGRTGTAIPALAWKNGERHKLRFINASTAAVHTLRITGHRFRVTHLDGHPLSAPYETETITLSPAERVDAEVAATGQPGGRYKITSDRPELGLAIPITYAQGRVGPVPSPFAPPASRAFPGIEAAPVYVTLELNSVMDHGAMMMDHSAMGHGSGMGSMNMGSMNMAAMTRWTLNGKSFPDTAPLPVSRERVTKVRLVNRDTQGMHRMDHPIHLHGTAFQVVSLNGKRPPREMWKDTINVPAGEYVDIAFRFRNPGEWMLHCHIIDHEDGGMMTVVQVR